MSRDRFDQLVPPFLRPTETEQGEWQGALSIYSEWHALAIGFGAGFLSALTDEPTLAVLVATYALGEEIAAGSALLDIQREPAYACAGLVLGYLVGLVAPQS